MEDEYPKVTVLSVDDPEPGDFHVMVSGPWLEIPKGMIARQFLAKKLGLPEDAKGIDFYAASKSPAPE